MSEVNVEVDDSEFQIKIADGLVRELPSLTSLMIEEAAPIVDEEFGLNMPVRTGHMKDTRQTIINSDEAIFRTTSGYGKAVDEGSKPHIITARNGQALQFEIGGITLYRKSIHHPGFAGHHFKEKTIQSSAPRVLDAIKSLIDRTLGRL